MGKKCLWGCVGFAAFMLAACGEDSAGTNSVEKNDEASDKGDIIQIEDVDDLPNCTAKREGLEASTEDGDKYVCKDGEWKVSNSDVPSYETEDDLPNCTEKREGALAHVEETDETYTCNDGEWIEEGSTPPSNDDSEENDDGEDPGDDDGGNAGSSSSREKSSSSIEVATEDDLPNCTSKREGVLAYVDDVAAIYVCRKGAWVEVTGTRPSGCKCTSTTTSPIEVSADNPQNVTWTVRGCTADDFSNFTYTWSKGYSGSGATANKSISTAGNYAPKVTVTAESDTVITCQEVLALESSSSSTVTDPPIPEGSCSGSATAITKGSQVTWTFTPATLDPSSLSGSLTEKLAQMSAYTELVNSSTCEWTIEGAGENGEDLTVSGACGDDAKTVIATYANISDSDFSTSVKLGDKTIQCGNVAVSGTPVTGCTCTVDDANPDVKDGDVTVTWTVSGCKTGTVAADIATYTWTGPTGSTATATATVSQKGETQTASVRVTSTENASMDVTCPSVKAVNSDQPDYIIEEINGTQVIPVGSCVTIVGPALSNGVSVRCYHSWQNTSCTYTLAAGTTSVTETSSNCNTSPGTPLAMSAVRSNNGQVCITEAVGVTEVTCKVYNW